MLLIQRFHAIFYFHIPTGVNLTVKKDESVSDVEDLRVSLIFVTERDSMSHIFAQSLIPMISKQKLHSFLSIIRTRGQNLRTN